MYPAAPLPLAVEEADALLRNVPEAVLQEVWQRRRFRPDGLTTTSGSAVEVVHPGRANPDAGPDFTDARVLLTDDEGHAVLLAGDVEVHRTSGEWLYHRHDADPRYDRVVLHVVFSADRHTGRLRRSDGTPLPEVVLDSHLDDSLRRLLFRFFAQPAPDFACAPRWTEVPDRLRRPWLRRLGRRRLLERARRLAPNGDPHEALYVGAFRALGYAPNADAMEELARRAPAALLHRLDDPLDREALLFHAAGLLPDPATFVHSDPTASAYARELARRARRIAGGLPAAPLPASRWTFFRLRPNNFPPLRIAQVAALCAPVGPLGPDGLTLAHDAVEVPTPLDALRRLHTAPSPSPFWQDHVRFEALTRPHAGRIGRERADRLVADAVLPALLLDALARRDTTQISHVLRVAASIPVSSDVVTRRYALGGYAPEDEVEAQGLRALAVGWCERGRCLECAVGRHLLRTA